ncbi:Aminodeoxychorismate synthase component 1 [Planctomycetes bacterium Pla86]|uniref:Aminodeoxychorismate synthase component 1 n=1 Tax=Engelhardtia mirabilis TaxID=2528011 RepID=A0A518BM21_9BACT|nr:Aminodeoxychorismate synthase component 1 [Planctomycetes bacterium Pla133]QDV02354.1 Aminodeoxychorismate synthase component 1 [Planctomycetes bacterium Pla86]
MQLEQGIDAVIALRAAVCLGGPVALDSVAGSPRRWSLVGFDPLVRAEGTTSIAGLRDLVGQIPDLGVQGPFAGGFIGALAYDLGVAGEALELPAEPWGQPLIAGGLYTDFFLLDHVRGTATLVAAELDDDPRGPLERRLEHARDRLADARVNPPPLAVAGRGLKRHTPPEEHRQRVEAVRELIRDGELYQANIAHRISCSVDQSPLALYESLRAANPAPYAGYLEFPGGALLSSSPELLLDFDGREAVTRPIKGTAPRGIDDEEDARLARELLASVKDRAELAMIVDLERNDLGRVATPGGVSVDAFPELERYAAVQHLVATVRARPRPGVDAVALLEALFPGGSITGAPKLRSMEAIALLEGEGRGFFTGSLGFLDTRGRACFDILIRTLLWRPTPGGGEVSLRVGGGITWDSDPAAEESETIHKARAMLAALGLDPREAVADAAGEGSR